MRTIPDEHDDLASLLGDYEHAWDISHVIGGGLSLSAGAGLFRR